MDGVIELRGVEGDADGYESIHLVVFLCDAIVLGVFLEILRAGDVHEDMAEHADGIGVTAHHHVTESYVVVGCEMGGHDAREHGLFVKFDVVKGFKRQTEITQQAVHAQEADDGEVA